MVKPFPHQIEGAKFLAARKTALLADEQRVGKTGAAIRACDYVLAQTILVITTSSGRGNWAREMREWGIPRNIQVVFKGTDKIRADADVVIVGWGGISRPQLHAQLTARKWDVLLPDEGHYAKNPVAKRTIALYGEKGLHLSADKIWPLSGTPMPNAPDDLFPMLKALAPDRLKAGEDWPDVSTFDKFQKRYCTGYMKNNGWSRIFIVTGGKNLDELKARLDGFWLRRTQQDVGIGKPIFSVYSLTPERMSDVKQIIAAMGEDAEDILAAAEYGETKTLELHLGPLRRITGTIKAHAVVQAVKEEFECGLDKIVLMAWHSDVIDILREGLAEFGVAGIDGRTPPAKRDAEVQKFQTGSARVFVGQIQAAGEAIDLSSAAMLWFVEASFVPKDMSQAALRITNHSQTRQAHVRVCALGGSIDEALMRILTRKVETIRTVMEN